MSQSYEQRLLIPIDGNSNTIFHTTNGLVVAHGYKRIVIGQRGPYIEFTNEQIKHDNIFIPDSQEWRLTDKRIYYHEWRTKKDYVKLYYQRKTVKYADYRIGLWYVSPFDLRVNKKEIITSLQSQRDLFGD